MSDEERSVFAVGTQHAASASEVAQQNICIEAFFLGHSSGGRSMLRPYSVVGYSSGGRHILLQQTMAHFEVSSVPIMVW